MFFVVEWDGQECGSGYPSFRVRESAGRGRNREGRAGSYERWFDRREDAAAHAAEKNKRARRLLAELLEA